MAADADTVVDARGLICPEPVMLLHNAVRDAESGHIIKVVATDPSTKRDIAHFCEFLGHALLNEQHDDDVFVFFVQKKMAQ